MTGIPVVNLDQMSPTTLAKYLRQQRERLGLTHAEVAKHLNLTIDEVKSWETTEATPPANRFMDVIQVLKIDELEMFEILAQDSMERWRSFLLSLSGKRTNKSG